ncbi:MULTISPECIES: NUDIX domain-containing protein [Vibrio]|uniref:NUDIX domain-containing protein n=1 Tax=Vibrio TaxID=662 RepID=UPI002076467E|nr:MULTISPECIES: NUDIX domain-containing protein [Vibrio]USD31660.1 NUDIX domain-containing protein [Vibrio sp. SCSIO 43186]USD44704.1 NUDIX domain-containing protein [Vibrio sp. SCSIO 43145]USD68783.1 NUDIX domain-containing protein [Vibrio sp. SCSIO 43139]USD96473.1 pyrophosphatase [Vibrio coralliilyticus]
MEHRIRAAGILIDNDAILLLKVKDFSGEYWIPPGGGMEEGDRSSKDCVVREFKEEAGLDIEVGELICVREFFETHRNRYHSEFFYRVSHYDGEPHIENLLGLNDEDYIQSVAWVALGDVSGKRIYPKELKDKVLELIDTECFSTHLGSYTQGDKEDLNRL